MPRPSLAIRLTKTVRHTWDLGFTSFGGPPVHFGILYRRFVERQGWVSQQTYEELFGVCQSLPGPASTKVLYTIVLTHLGLLPALVALAFWCLPGALGMFGLAQGVSKIETILPDPVYALLSGLNAATVGLIALAGFQLSTRTITDGLSRTVLIGTACAGMLYTALWYFPVLMILGALLAIVWDLWMKAWMKKEVVRLRKQFNDSRKRRRVVPPSGLPSEEGVPKEISETTGDDEKGEQGAQETTVEQGAQGAEETTAAPDSPPAAVLSVTTKQGIAIIIAFFVIFITLMVLRSTIKDAPVELRLFINLFLAGTIIFGGGPVVVPLLREYVVAEGWVSSRDFLIGLALIQAFPGPNFNFAVYLAALAAKYTTSPPAAMALLGFFAIFGPGITLATGFQSLWRRIRTWRAMKSTVRGVNSAAVGLIWTAVYRLWEIGYLRAGFSTGASLGQEPWFLVIASIAFCGNQWYGIPAPVAILIGGVLGLIRFAIVGRN